MNDRERNSIVIRTAAIIITGGIIGQAVAAASGLWAGWLAAFLVGILGGAFIHE